MSMSNQSKGVAIAAVAAALFAIAPLVARADAGTGNGACFGVNACKGKSSCKSASNACKGMNGCKGKGFIEEVSRETCDQLGGKFRTYDDVKQEQAQH